MEKLKRYSEAAVTALAIISGATELYGAEMDECRFIDENRVWVYKSTEDFGATHLISYMKFDGVKESGGREYHRFHTFKTQKGEQGVTYPEFNHSPSERDFYLREEDRRVWLLVENHDGEWDGEILLYDFNLGDGDSITLHPMTDSDHEESYTVRTSDPIDFCGQRCKVLWYEELEMPKALNIYMIEGIGPSTHGTLGYYSLLYTSGEGTDDSSDGGMTTRPDADLLMVCDAGGNVIFNNEKDGPNTGVDAIEHLSGIFYDGHTVVASGCDLMEIYGLNGLAIRHLEGSDTVSVDVSSFPGGVYVAVAEADGATVARRKFVVR